MTRIYLLILIVFASLACAESIEFGRGNSVAVMIDAELSTSPGKTYVHAIEYTDRVESGEESISDFEIHLLSENGDDVLLTYDFESERYFPFEGFAAQVGVSYSLLAIHPNGYRITSTSDAVDEPVDFDLILSDTVFSIFTENSKVANVGGVAAQIEIQPNRAEYYAQFRYQNTYIDYYSGDTVDRSEEDLIFLFSCEGADCQSRSKETVRLEQYTSWYFQNKVDSVCDQTFPDGQCPEPECCIFFQDYKTLMSMNMEVMSKETYRFWEEVELLRNNDGLVFDTFPFPIRSNLECEGCPFDLIGNFRVTAEASESQTIFL